MKARLVMLGVVLVAAIVLAVALTVANASAEHGRGSGGVIYVRSQGLYYDTFATKDPLPPHGRFQLLESGPHGSETDYGPGDVGYLGGRWKVDIGGGEYHYFLCPLLGPGRESP